ncbi:hypothetical protein GCM10012319_35750 [Comamonas sp. KCTC 72670]|nr:hypothetical protein GCM10012319_35750 [Comamonas sp. KCTC 72670]
MRGERGGLRAGEEIEIERDGEPDSKGEDQDQHGNDLHGEMQKAGQPTVSPRRVKGPLLDVPRFTL